MKLLRYVPIWVFVFAMVLAMNTGCTTSPEKNSNLDSSLESEDKKLDSSGYY